MIVRAQQEAESLRKAGKILAKALQHVASLTRPGVTTAELDLAAEKYIRDAGAVPAFLNYQPEGAHYPFPAALCVSINEEVVHGIPRETTIVKEGDLVMLDLGLSYNGYFSDAAVTVIAGKGSAEDEKLVAATKEALLAGVAAAKVGGRIGDISAAIEAVGQKHGLGIVEDLGGHSLGTVPHEGPFVANVGKKGTGEKITEGLVLAIEPIFTQGKGDIVLADDQWTYLTSDGSRCAEFEHTVLVTKNGAEILTAA